MILGDGTDKKIEKTFVGLYSAANISDFSTKQSKIQRSFYVNYFSHLISHICRVAEVIL